MTLVQIKQAATLMLAGATNSRIARSLKVDIRLIRKHTNAIKFECGLMLARAE